MGCSRSGLPAVRGPDAAQGRRGLALVFVFAFTILPMAHPGPTRTMSSRIRSIFSGSVGNLVEWFDWYVYSAFALYFAPAFFPKGDQTAQLLQTAAIFAVGFVMRPLGAWLMGVYADHRGRKAGLTLSVSLMCVGSLLIAVAPTYAQAGLLSPATLLL